MTQNNQERKNYPFKELLGYTKFAEDKSKSRRIGIGMVGFNYYFQIAKPDGTGLNFKDRKLTVVLYGDYIESQIMNAARHMMDRLKAMKRGKEFPINSPIILYGGREFKKSPYKIEFNIIQSKKDNKYFPILTIRKYKKDSYEKPELEETFFFGEGKLYFKKDDATEFDTKVYAFFESIKLQFESIIAKTHTQRAEYLRHMDDDNDEESSGKSSSQQSDTSSDDDDDDYEVY